MLSPPPIEDSFEKIDRYLSVTERYYTSYKYVPKACPSEEDHLILVHSNKICLITLAPSHPVIKEKKNITKLDFRAGGKLDRLDNQVRGKGKKGGQILHPESILCNIECDDNTHYTVRGCLKGKLVEINQNLLNNHQLLVEKPLSDGYIAIVLAGLKDIGSQLSHFTLLDKNK